MDAHTTGAGTRNTALGDFLRSRRARISPERAGLAPEPTARRVPGLRREEIARLAGVSVDYYVRLERGHQVNASGPSSRPSPAPCA
ncbi:helix-turn-helix domain-containing protein [Actinacidiphila glaucinigra]|uniref:helix-turn-helix domain-containing protein n=1 Tax=Actinacidiphila glaucinigra TaxID=235986 RepID=UPI0036AA3517